MLALLGILRYFKQHLKRSISIILIERTDCADIARIQTLRKLNSSNDFLSFSYPTQLNRVPVFSLTLRIISKMQISFHMLMSSPEGKLPSSMNTLHEGCWHPYFIYIVVSFSVT